LREKKNFENKKYQKGRPFRGGLKECHRVLNLGDKIATFHTTHPQKGGSGDSIMRGKRGGGI